LRRDGLELAGSDAGEGPAVVFQHGLGGDDSQVSEAFPQNGFRRLTLECRSHGGSAKGNGFSIAQFADDVLAFADARGVRRFAAGGISMGAAIVLRIAVLAPQRVSALILVRPAWTWEPAPANMRAFVELSGYLKRGGKADFGASPLAKELAVTAPDNLASMLKFFDAADPANTATLLTAIAGDGPGVSERDVRAIGAPTLVIGNAIDHVHPLAHARALASAIPGAAFFEIAAKALDKPRHLTELRAAIGAFLLQLGQDT
jgi:pimeloyl-ACP methyl ester carboxylesterase